MAKRKVNKSQKVRDYLAKHPEAGPTAVATALKRFGISVALVSAIKARGNAGSTKKRKGKAAKRTVRKARAAHSRNVEPVIAAAEFIRACGGVEEAQAAMNTATKIAAALGR